jgi:hypothetical protein
MHKKALDRHIWPSRTIILPVILFGRETWSLSQREEQRLTVRDDGVLTELFGMVQTA